MYYYPLCERLENKPVLTFLQVLRHKYSLTPEYGGGGGGDRQFKSMSRSRLLELFHYFTVISYVHNFRSTK